MAAAMTVLTGCHGIFSGIYDEPADEDTPQVTAAGQLYIDASSWTQWHFIDLDEVVDSVRLDSLYNPSQAWVTYPIPLTAVAGDTEDGIYTYWFDVFGQGLSNREFREFTPTAAQEEPEHWTFAVHRNNVMTNGCTVAATDYTDIDALPTGTDWLEGLQYTADHWNESDVWVIQDQMLLGLIGCQGIAVNETLSQWLKIDIPPMPPAFTLNSRVFVLRTPEGRHAALQLVNYQSATGTKCVLTINYRYPL